MLNWKKILLPAVCLLSLASVALAQSIHYSQYYNAPLLINPANTGLMSQYDFRLGLNYRNQWAVIPVPYNTFSAFGDFKIGGNKENTSSNNWLGLGFLYNTDKAGDGNLSLSQFQMSVAYHVQTSEFTQISLGFSGATVSRAVNYDQLTFDEQWDGFTFNQQLPNGEKLGLVKTSYTTIGTGINIAWFPTEFVYIKLGGAVANINQPVESFYGSSNQIMMRETGNLDMFFQAGEHFVINPSAYFETQSGANELLAGALTRTTLSGGTYLGGSYDGGATTQLILGGFIRVGDALIAVAGIQYGNIQFMANYDITTSSLAPYNAGYGAMELSLIYQGQYGRNKDAIKKTLGCPRFF